VNACVGRGRDESLKGNERRCSEWAAFSLLVSRQIGIKGVRGVSILLNASAGTGQHKSLESVERGKQSHGCLCQKGGTGPEMGREKPGRVLGKHSQDVPGEREERSVGESMRNRRKQS
jgi:hypothetical protein